MCRPFPFSFLFLFLILFSSCATSRIAERRFSKKIQKEVKKSPVFNRAFTGFTLLDPETGETLADVNGDKYFTPASNTKILTLATCLQVLGDSVPGMIWWGNEKDGIGIAAVGDPTFLHPKFEAWQTIFKDLKALPKETGIWVDIRHWNDLPLGPGWAWDDADFGFSAERTFFPMYGNVKRLYAVRPDSLTIEPPFWKESLWKMPALSLKENEPYLHFNNNEIWYGPDSLFKTGDEIWVSVLHSKDYLKSLLEDTLRRQISWGGDVERRVVQLPLRYSCPIDTVLRCMMHHSDNFIAEQMLLTCGSQKFDILQQDTVIKWMLDSVLTSLPQRPRWVDGSGLSRYNLISPRDLTEVLLKLWKEQAHERLLSLFPAGGLNGTVADWYKGEDGKPYVFAKTGSMSGVHCLSGYIATKRGKTLIFSFMHNNFTGSNKPWKAEMQRMLEFIRERG